MTIDEAIKYIQYDIYNFDDEDKKQIAEWLEELKTIKEMDLSIPQHFTKEQSEWIKTYCIQRNKEFYDKAIDDIVPKAYEWLMTMDIIDCDGCNYQSECVNRNMNCFDVMSEKFLKHLNGNYHDDLIYEIVGENNG